MALSTIGNLTYINQASNATSSIQAGNLHHPTPLNHSIFQEQMQRTEQVRPTEESKSIDEREKKDRRDGRKNNEEMLDSQGKNFQENLEESLERESQESVESKESQDLEYEIFSGSAFVDSSETDSMTNSDENRISSGENLSDSNKNITEDSMLIKPESHLLDIKG